MNRRILLASAFCIVGIALIGFTFVWITVIEPDLEKLPTDLDESLIIEANVREIFPSPNETEVTIERTQQAMAQEDGVLIVREEIIPTPEVPGLLEKMVLEMGVNRTSREFVAGYGDIERSDLWAYPIGVEKKTYSLWSDTAGRATDAHFVAEEDVDGLPVYSFITDEKNIPYGKDPTFGFPVILDIVIEEKVEPHTGIIVDGTSTRTFKVTLPAEMAAMLPENLQASLMPDASSDGDIVVPAVVVSQQYSEQTVALKVADAKDLRTQLIWATRYGLWIGYGCGAILAIAGLVLFIHPRLPQKRTNTKTTDRLQTLALGDAN